MDEIVHLKYKESSMNHDVLCTPSLKWRWRAEIKSFDSLWSNTLKSAMSLAYTKVKDSPT